MKLHVILLGALLAALPVLPHRDDDDLDRMLAAIVPASEELAFREIPWRPTFWDGVVEAREQDRPVLLWAMNGHPLGCT